MFDKTIKFFIENYKINYALFIFLFIVGIYSYTKIPKEVQPTIEPSTIRVSGNYSGASVDILNKMAVIPLENEVKNIVGVDNIITNINPGKFSITLELDKHEKKEDIKENVKDAIAMIISDLPADMDEPLIKTVAHARSLMYVSVLSTKISRDDLLKIAKDLKTTLLGIPFISDITIFGESDEYYEIQIDEKKIKALGLEKENNSTIIA